MRIAQFIVGGASQNHLRFVVQRHPIDLRQSGNGFHHAAGLGFILSDDGFGGKQVAVIGNLNLLFCGEVVKGVTRGGYRNVVIVTLHIQGGDGFDNRRGGGFGNQAINGFFARQKFVVVAEPNIPFLQFGQGIVVGGNLVDFGFQVGRNGFGHQRGNAFYQRVAFPDVVNGRVPVYGLFGCHLIGGLI